MKQEETNEEEDDEEQPLQEKYKKHKDIFVKIIDLQVKFQQRVYLDQTGKFSTTSSQGNQYIMVLAEMDSNAIMQEPM